MSIETALKKWCADYSGITNVIQAPFSGKRPASPFITFQPISFDYSDFDEKNRVSKDAQYVTHNYQNWASMIVSVHCYSDKAYQAINSLRLSMMNWQARNLLKTENMALKAASAVNNLSGLDGATNRHHWQADFEFNILIVSSIDIDKINTWILTGTWTDGNNNTFTNSTIKYPKL